MFKARFSKGNFCSVIETGALARAQPHQTGRNLYLIDSKTLYLPRGKYDWATFRKSKAGVIVHLIAALVADHQVPPEAFSLAPDSVSNQQEMDVFLNQLAALYVFDRGHLNYKCFERIHFDGYFFVSRIKKKSNVLMLQENPLTSEENDTFLSAQTVLMGSPSPEAVRYRVITVKRPWKEPLKLTTNHIQMPALEVAELYQARWQIKLLFKNIRN